MTQGGWRYYYLPSVYHGAIATRVLKEISKFSGRVFHSTQPDIFTALAVPVFVDNFICLPFPVTIGGRSEKSNGGASIARNGEDVVSKFVNEFGNYKYHQSMPYLKKPLGYLIPDAFLLAKDIFPSLYSGIKFDYSAMWAFLRRLKLIKKGYLYAQYNKIEKYHKINFLEFEFYCLIHDLAGLRRRVVQLIQSRKIKESVPSNIYDFSINYKKCIRNRTILHTRV